MSESSSGFLGYAEKLIRLLGIGSRRNPSSHPHTLFSTDYSREKLRQEIRGKVREAGELLEKRVELMKSLDGRPILVGQEGSASVFHLEFDSAFSGMDSEGKAFVSTSDQSIPEGTAIFFMANKTDGWKIEPIASPNLENAYFRKLAEEEGKCERLERKNPE